VNIKLSIFVLLFLFTNLTGQTEKLKNNSVYLELLGNGGSWFSVNYEKMLHYNEKIPIHNTFRIGFSFSSNRFDHKPIYNIPFEFNTLLGRQKHFIEIGFGLTAFIGTSNLKDTILPIDFRTNFWNTYFIRIGYRYMGDGIVFRASPLIGFTGKTSTSNNREAVFGLGISIGPVFNFRREKNIIDGYSK
jgi:hypothetical protein